VEENLRLYNKSRAVPDTAKRAIQGGRLKGMTDISPMWRIKTLTELFGPCGVGWNVRQTGAHTASDEATGETAVFVDVELTYRETPDADWSAPVFGTGGAKLVAVEKNGIHLDDEAYKKAYTDAISVACKALGVGADVYWERDADKYGYGERSEESLKLIEEIFSFGTPNDINAISVKSKGRMVDQLNDDELKALAEFLRARHKPAAEPEKSGPEPEKEEPEKEKAAADARHAEVVRARKILLDLALANGIDEKSMRTRAEAYIGKRDGVLVRFDDMTLNQLIAVKVKFTQVVKNADQAS
jgi:hypothetical protein